MMEADDHLLLILHKVPKPACADREAVVFWRDPAGAWKSTSAGSGPGALKAHLDEFVAVIDKLEDRIQQNPAAETYFDILQHTGPLLRTVRNMHTTLQQAREAFSSERAIIVARDKAAEIERAVDLLHADAKNGLEYMVARQAEEQSRNSQQLLLAGHRLNLLVALFLPLTALGSAFGMNLRHGLEHITSPLLFWSTLVGGLAIGFLVKALLNASAGRKQPAL
jgi:hypothetical protein